MNGIGWASFFRFGAKEFASYGRGRLERSRGGPFPDRPANRHSEVLEFLARPGSGWATKANFSNINKDISTIRQSHQRDFTTEYAGIASPGRNSCLVRFRERTFLHIRVLSIWILRTLLISRVEPSWREQPHTVVTQQFHRRTTKKGGSEEPPSRISSELSRPGNPD